MIDVIESAWRRVTACAFLAGMLVAPLSACSQDDTVAASYKAYNHTATPIDSVIINGQGGILNVSAYGGGGKEVCCVVLPSKWHPGLKVTIKWQRGGHWVRDQRGQIVEKDGHKQFIEGEWNEKTVDVPEYVGGDQTGQFRIHFFPNDDVKVTVLPYGPGHKDYPYPYPKDPKVGKDTSSKANIAISEPGGLTKFLVDNFADALLGKEHATIGPSMVEVSESGARLRVTTFPELMFLAVATANTNGKVLHHLRMAARLEASAGPTSQFEDGLLQVMETSE